MTGIPVQYGRASWLPVYGQTALHRQVQMRDQFRYLSVSLYQVLVKFNRCEVVNLILMPSIEAM